MKLKLNALLVFGLLTLLLNCEVPFDNNARLLVKGQVIDENNNPISGAEIGVFVRRDDNFAFNTGPSGSGGKLLGNDISATDGTFSIITLLGRDSNFAVEVYVNQDYTNYTYRTDTQNFTPTNFLIDLETVRVNRRAEFNYNITRMSLEGTELQYSFEYQNSFCSETYISEQLNVDETFCFETNSLGGNLNTDNPEVSNAFPSFVSSQVTFTYSINGQPQESQILTIDQPEYEFNFSY